MSNETDRDWLARNVHVWPEGKREALVCWPRNVDTLIWSYVSSDVGWITKDQWLARRAELQNKPSWAHAPEWAVYMAQSPNGHWEFFAVKPRAEGWWRHPIGERSSANNASIRGTILGDWRDTLENRPSDLSEQMVISRLQEATDNVLAAAPELMTDKYKFEPFVSIEDNQEQEMKQDSGWYERGELPPVGVECEAKKYEKEEWYKVVICGAGKHLGLAVAFYEKQKGSGAFTCSSAEYFRPIRTERDELIRLIKTFRHTLRSDGEVADTILAAGFKLEAK